MRLRTRKGSEIGRHWCGRAPLGRQEWFAMIALTLATTAATAAEPRSDTAASTSSSRRCGRCWSSIVTSATPRRRKSPKGGLRLDSLDGMTKGGDTGPAVVPGDARGQPAGQGGDDTTTSILRMPPKGKLPEATIATLEQWVKGRRGRAARRGRDADVARRSRRASTLNAARSHWAYQPIRRPAIPAVNDGRLAAIAGRLVRAGQARGRRA